MGSEQEGTYRGKGLRGKGSNREGGQFKGIVQPFEVGGVTSLIRSAVKFCKAGHFNKTFLMIKSHERSLKQNSAA